jgi:hypothetical protein
MQAIAQPLLFADMHICPSELALLLEHFLMHNRRGSSPGAYTKRLHVHGGYSSDVEWSTLTALLPFMHNLRSFSARGHLITSPVIITLGQHGPHILQTLEIYVKMSDALDVLAATMHFSTLRTLRIELVLYEDVENTNLLDASPPLALTRLVHFEMALSDVCLFPPLARWLARCELPMLEHLALLAHEDYEGWTVESARVMLVDFVPFFATHQDLRVLSVDACEEVALAFLALELPPGLRRISLPARTSSLPRTLPALPSALRQLALRAEPEDSSLWDLLAHLLREPSLSLTDIIVVIEETPSTERHPECVRSFSWREILLPPCGIDKLDDRHVQLCGNMVLYALRFKQRGIAIVDGHGCVWPGDGQHGQWSSVSGVDFVLTMDQKSPSHHVTNREGCPWSLSNTTVQDLRVPRYRIMTLSMFFIRPNNLDDL